MMKKFRTILLIILMFALTVSGLTLVLSENDEIAQAAKATSVEIFGQNIVGDVDLSTIDFGFEQDEQDPITGNVSFHSGVLTLDNVHIQYIYVEMDMIFVDEGDLEIICVGENILSNSYTGSKIIYLKDGSLTLSGEGSLKINSSATPIYLENGNLDFACNEVFLSNNAASIWLSSAKIVHFSYKSNTKIFGGVRAISNLDGEEFLNVEYDEHCGIRTGTDENDVLKVDLYGGENFIYAYTNAVLTSTNKVFDKYSPSKIYVTMEKNGNELYGITGLTQGSDYSINDNIVTLEKSCFTNRPVGDRQLSFTFDPGDSIDFVVSIVDTTPTTNVTLSIKSATYDAAHPTKIETLVSQPKRFASAGNISKENYFYDESTGRFEFTDYYLEGLTNNNYSFIFSFTGESTPEIFILKVINSDVGDIVNPPTGQTSILLQSESVFDKFEIKPENIPIVVDVDLKGNSLLQIKNGLDEISHRYYTRINGKVTIDKNYLNNLDVGKYVFTFVFSDGEDQTLNVEIKNTDPLPNNLSPFYDNPIEIPTIDESTDTNIPEPIVDGNGDTAALIILGIFGAVGVLGFVVWIILRKKRIV